MRASLRWLGAVCPIVLACGCSGGAPPPPGPPAASASADPTGATSQAPPDASTTIVEFRSPTGNIRCAMVRDAEGESSARCDIAERTWTPPPRPADCDLDWGQAFSAGPNGPGALECVGDTVAGQASPVLPYGQSKRLGDMECTSTRAHVRCVAIPTGQGFEVARGSYRLF